MTILTATQARSTLFRLLEEANRTHEPITITGKHGNAVLVSEDDWRAIQETLTLLAVPGMRDSLRAGMATPVDDCSEDPGW
jgi:antitoxin YefM